MPDDVFVAQLITKSLIVSKDSTERFFTGLLTVQIKDKQGEILIVDELMKTLPIWMKRGGFISDTHCHKSDTRVLTDSGFKYFYDVTGTDYIATLNPQTHRLEYQLPSEVEAFDYNGKLINFSNMFYDISVTPNHRMYVKNRERKDEWKFMTAKELKTDMSRRNHRESKYRFKKNCEYIGKKLEFFEIPVEHKNGLVSMIRYDGDSWVKFMAWYLSEGWFQIQKDGHYRIGISQSDVNHIKKQEIKELTDSMGLNGFWCKDSISFHSKPIVSYLKQFGKVHDKFIPNEIKNASKEQIISFLDTYIKGDGNNNNKRQIFTTSDRMKDDLMELGIKAGYGVTIGKHPSGFKPGNFAWSVNLSRHRTLEPNVWNNAVEEDYNGKVYCVTVPNGIILTERNGKYCWSGNSNRIVGKGINYAKTTVKSNGTTYPAIEITGVIFKDYKLDDDIWRRMQSGEYRGLSFGGATKSDREPVTYSDGSLAYNLKDLEHYEVAVCRDPAVPLALITGIHTLAKAQASAPEGVTYQTKDLGNGLCQFGCKNAGIYVTKPMGQYEDFASCTAANSDKDNPEAYCGEIKHRTEDTNKAQGCTVCGAAEMDHTSNAGHSYVSKGMIEARGSDSKCPYCGYQPELGAESYQTHMDKEHPDKNKSHIISKDDGRAQFAGGPGGSGTRSDPGARGDNDNTGQHGIPATETGNIDEKVTKGPADVPPQNEDNMPHPNEPVDPTIDQASHRTKYIRNVLDTLELNILLSKIGHR